MEAKGSAAPARASAKRGGGAKGDKGARDSDDDSPRAAGGADDPSVLEIAVPSSPSALPQMTPRLLTPTRESKGGGPAPETPEPADVLDALAATECGCRVRFELPDGRSHEAEFKMGQTVEVLKSYLSMTFGLPFDPSTQLFLGGALMFDPLSLSDFPAIVDALEATVVVEGELPPQGAAEGKGSAEEEGEEEEDFSPGYRASAK